MIRKIHPLLKYTNIARPLCDHLMGSQHTHIHHMSIGVILMSTGVIIAKMAGHSEFLFLSYIGDGIGYAIHGLGLTPFLEHLTAIIKQKE